MTAESIFDFLLFLFVIVHFFIFLLGDSYIFISLEYFPTENLIPLHVHWCNSYFATNEQNKNILTNIFVQTIKIPANIFVQTIKILTDIFVKTYKSRDKTARYVLILDPPNLFVIYSGNVETWKNSRTYNVMQEFVIENIIQFFHRGLLWQKIFIIFFIIISFQVTYK